MAHRSNTAKKNTKQFLFILLCFGAWLIYLRAQNGEKREGARERERERERERKQRTQGQLTHQLQTLKKKSAHVPSAGDLQHGSPVAIRRVRIQRDLQAPHQIPQRIRSSAAQGLQLFGLADRGIGVPNFPKVENFCLVGEMETAKKPTNNV